jgi:hypothetical protein
MTANCADVSPLLYFYLSIISVIRILRYSYLYTISIYYDELDTKTTKLH